MAAPDNNISYHHDHEYSHIGTVPSHIEDIYI